MTFIKFSRDNLLFKHLNALNCVSFVKKQKQG